MNPNKCPFLSRFFAEHAGGEWSPLSHAELALKRWPKVSTVPCDHGQVFLLPPQQMQVPGVHSICCMFLIWVTAHVKRIYADQYVVHCLHQIVQLIAFFFCLQYFHIFVFIFFLVVAYYRFFEDLSSCFLARQSLKYLCSSNKLLIGAFIASENYFLPFYLFYFIANP